MYAALAVMQQHIGLVEVSQAWHGMQDLKVQGCQLQRPAQRHWAERQRTLLRRCWTKMSTALTGEPSASTSSSSAMQVPSCQTQKRGVYGAWPLFSRPCGVGRACSAVGSKENLLGGP